MTEQPPSKDGWLDAPDLRMARQALTATAAPWVGGIGSAIYLAYLVMDLTARRYALVAMDAVLILLLGATFALALRKRTSPALLNRMALAGMACVTVNFGIAIQIDPALFEGPGFAILLASFGFLFLSWPTFLGMSGLTVAVWSWAAWSVGALDAQHVMGSILTAAGLGAVLHGSRLRMYDRLYREHAARIAHEASLRRQERLSALGTLVAGVAHEINNPLTYINGNIELAKLDIEDLLARPGLDAEGRKQLQELARMHDRALAGLEQIGRIVQGLRVVARDGTTGPLQPTRVDELLVQVLAVARTKLALGVVIVTRLDEPCVVAADPGRLSQVFLNLILNAGQAMEAQGEGTLTLHARQQGDKVTVEVGDTGPGIPPEVQERLFTPFATTKASGTGLGLSISRSIVVDHGGDITFTTVPSKGTTFVVGLPGIVLPVPTEPTAPAVRFERRVKELV